MNCLIVVPSLRRAGAETQAVDLANGLASIGHSLHLCSFEPQLDQQQRLTPQVRFHHVRRKSKYDLSFTSEIADLIEREQIDIVQGVMQFAALFAWLAALRSKGRPPVVAAIHTTVNRGLKEELHDRLLYRRILRQLPALIFVCEQQRDHWVSKYPELGPAARVVYNGVDVERFRRSEFEAAGRKLRTDLGIPPGRFVFTCIAGFRREKGHNYLIEAFAQQPVSSHLLLAGVGERLAETKRAVADAGLGNRVHFLGDVRDIRPVIAASDATVLSSTSVETFSMAMLESMAMEVPMVATRIGGLPEAIIHGATGLLCVPGNALSLAAQMRSLAEGQLNAQELGRAAAELVRRRFTLQKMVEGNAAVLHRAMTEARLPPARRPTATV
jgi:glycosyltransferase involved in cell wall biosynthesis